VKYIYNKSDAEIEKYFKKRRLINNLLDGFLLVATLASFAYVAYLMYHQPVI